MEDNSVIHVENLTKMFNDFVGVDAISFNVKKGARADINEMFISRFDLLCWTILPSAW